MNGVPGAYAPAHATPAPVPPPPPVLPPVSGWGRLTRQLPCFKEHPAMSVFRIRIASGAECQR